MSGISSKAIVHVVVGEDRKRKLKQYCLDNDIKMTEFICHSIDVLPSNVVNFHQLAGRSRRDVETDGLVIDQRGESK